jgi:hypothetical protein
MSFFSKRILNIYKEKALSALSTIENNFSSSNLITESGITEDIVTEYSRFIDSIQEPTIEPRPMQKGGLPIREDVEIPMAQAFSDIQLAHDQINLLREAALSFHNISSAEREGLNTLLRRAEDKITSFRFLTNDSDPDFQWRSDTFRSTSLVDPSSTIWLNPNTGVISLPVVSNKDLSSLLSNLELDKNISIGIPGNNLEILDQGIAENPELQENPKPTLYKQQASIDNYLQMFDGNGSTWFEWEANYIEPIQPTRTQADAMVYYQGGDPTDIFQQTSGFGWIANINWPGEENIDTNDNKGWPLVHSGLFKPSISQSPTANLLGSEISTANRNFKTRNAPCGDVASRLSFTVTFSQPINLSWIEVTPYIRESLFPTIKSIFVSSNGEKWKEILSNPVVLTPEYNESTDFSSVGVPIKNTPGVGVFPIPTTNTKFVRFIIDQEQTYNTKHGFAHDFFVKHLKKETKKSKLFGLIRSNRVNYYSERIPTPPQELGVSVRATGVPAGAAVYAGATLGTAIGAGIAAIGGSVAGGAAVGAAAAGGLVGLAVGALVAGIVGTKKVITTVLDVQESFDIFKGSRSFIGIRDVQFSSRIYGSTGQLISKAWLFQKPISKIAIIVNDFIPEDFPKGDWITYQISRDGSNWISINPQRGFSSPTSDSFIAIEPTNSLYVKIILSRPDDKDYESPVVSNYAVKCL